MSNVPPPPTPTPGPAPTSSELSPEQRRLLIGGVGLLIVVIAVLVVAVYFMVQNPAATSVIRDIFIIVMAFESLLIGLVLIVLMIQIARLTNLLQHEIKPILENTNETVNTVRSTAIFVSENLVDPVIKLNGYIAGLAKFIDLFNFATKK